MADEFENLLKNANDIKNGNVGNSSIKLNDFVESVTQEIINLKTISNASDRMKSDGKISIDDFSTGNMSDIKQFDGKPLPSQDVSILFKNNSSFEINQLSKMSKKEIQEKVNTFAMAADKQDVGNNGTKNDNKITSAELYAQIEQEKNLGNPNWLGIKSSSDSAATPTTENIIQQTGIINSAPTNEQAVPLTLAEKSTAATTSSASTTTVNTDKSGLITHADGSSKTAGEVWKENKGFMLGTGGVILGGLMAFFTGGSGWLMALFGILGFAGGAIADNGGFDGWGGGSSSDNSVKKTKEPKETLEQNQEIQEKEPEQKIETTLKFFQLKNGDMAVRGTVEGGVFTAKEVSVKRKDGNWNNQENGELNYTPVRNLDIIFPINGNDLGSDEKSPKNLDILQRIGNLGNRESIDYHTISQNIINQAKDTTKNTNFPVEQACPTESLTACTFGIGTQNPLPKLVQF